MIILLIHLKKNLNLLYIYIIIVIAIQKKSIYS